ncbi:hypothetical protein C8R45DRAFT_1217696 [Mycena sanguinolenta]|nr:hypothetical protein C8R45DRAFT_1217696 [Mycena sanguinolenta]
MQIALLKAERNIIQKKLKSIKYSVLKLPVEITSEIFVQCLPDLEDAHPIFCFSPLELPIPVLLTQVCRAWRAIAFMTPKIWAIFRIDIAAWPKDRSQGTLRLAEWMEWAGLSPLSFILRQEPYISTQIATLPAMLSPILSQSYRWQNAHICLPHVNLISKQFQSTLHGKLPLLETLEITSANHPPPTVVVSAFEMAPDLRRVVLEDLPPTMILLPWKQLTHFSTSSINGMDCMHVLRYAVSLIECKFGWVSDRDMDETALLPCRPTFEVLHLEGDRVCSLILALATLPSLIELRYGDGTDFEFEDNVPIHEHFVDFLSRSRPPLLRLCLHGGAYSRILHGFPFLEKLTSLEISHSNVAGMSGLLQNLRILDPNSFLPQLESLTSAVWSGEQEMTGINYRDLADALEFRCNLTSFRMTWTPYEWLLYNHPQDLHDNLPRLQRLIGEGMNISVIALLEYEGEVTSHVWI